MNHNVQHIHSMDIKLISKGARGEGFSADLFENSYIDWQDIYYHAITKLLQFETLVYIKRLDL